MSLFGNKPSGGGLFGNKPAGGGGLFGGGSNTNTGGGGLFGGGGNTQQPTGGGLFGGGGNTQQPTGGGLFGGANNQPKPGGLFGSANTSSGFGGGNTGGGGLFGGGGANTQSTGGGGLFGAKPANTGGGGLFGGGGNTQQNTGGGGLFGGSSNTGGMSSGGGGLFGSKPANTGGGGLFGGSNNTGAQPSMNKPATSSFGGGSSSGGGLFGSSNNTSSGGGGLFGSSNTAKPAGGGLFGSSNTASSGGGGGLFGSTANKPAGGGLFGSSTTNTASSGGGGLFGSKPAASSGGGLFSSNNTSSTPSFGQSSGGTSGGGLFGSSANKPAGGGLFGSSTAKPAGGGLFGSSNTSSGGGGLFGSSSNTGGGFGSSNTGSTPAFGSSSGTGGGLFGSSSGTSGGGLFGSSNNNTGGGGLFSSGTSFGATSQPVAQQPTQGGIDQSYIQAYTQLNQDPYGVKGIEEALKLSNLDADKQAVLNKIVQQVVDYSEERTTKTKSSTYESTSIFSGESSFKSTPVSLKFGHRYGDSFSGSFRRPENPYFSSKKDSASKRDKLEAYTRQLEYSKAKNDQSYLRYTNNFLQSKFKEMEGQGSQGTKPRESPSQSLRKSDARESMEISGPNTIRVKVHVFIEDTEKQIFINIDKSRLVRELVSTAVSKLKNEYPAIEEGLIQVVHKSRILNLDSTLQDSNVESGMSFDMLVQEQYTATGETARPEEEQPTSRKRQSETNQPTRFVSRDKLPILRNTEYSLTPDLIEMARMTEYELMNVKDLIISNEHGQVHWPDRTDVRGLNFDQLVEIRPYSATVYPDEIEEKGLKHPEGEGLNKPAIIALYNVFQRANDYKSPAAFEESLKNRAETLESCTFLSFNREKGELKFKVEHFTKYDFTMASDGEEEQEESEVEPLENKIPQYEPQKEKERFSFGYQQPKGYMGYQASSGAVHDQGNLNQVSEEDEEEMEVDHNRRSYRRAHEFLDDIKEDSASEPHSDVVYDDKPYKQGKIDFGEVMVKQFEEEKPYEPMNVEDEEEEDEMVSQNFVLDANAIRAKIKHRKQAIQKSLDDFNQRRVEIRKGLKETLHLKSSNTKGKLNQILYKRKVDSVNAVLGSIKPSFTSNIDLTYQQAVRENTFEKFDETQKDNLVHKYMSEHYDNILTSHLEASKIQEDPSDLNITERMNAVDLNSRKNAGNTNVSAKNRELPTIDPPKNPNEYTDMWFEILRKSRETLSPNKAEANRIANILLDEIKTIVRKDCQTFALLNA